MNTHFRRVLQLTLLCLFLCTVSFAADATPADASLYVVHGIPGRDVTANVNPGFPVDVLLNDEDCLIHGLTFVVSSGPFTLPAGAYDIKVSPANSLLPCSNPSVAETSVDLAAGGAATVVLALSSGTPTLMKFGDNLKTVEVNQGRVSIANAADAGTLAVRLTPEPVVKGSKTYNFTIAPGSEATADLPIGVYQLSATASGGTTPLVGALVAAENQSVQLVYITGSVTNNAVAPVTRLIRYVF
jgi:hypothetical protein